MQVWKVDQEGYFTGESCFVEEPSDNEIPVPMTVGYVKAKWTGMKWEEGATEQEIQEWEDSQIASQPTEIEILQTELANTNAMILELTELILGGM